MTIYADILVALNVLITYILLVATRVLCKMPANKWLVMLASVSGGFTSLIIFYDNCPVFLSLIYKIITGVVIVCLAFLPKSIRGFLKVFFGFSGVSLLFGGAVYALQLTLRGEKILYYNGTIYFDMSISYLVGCVLSVYGVFLLADYLITKNSFKNGKCQLEITYNNATVSTTAFIDTGNTLTDGMEGRPVVVAELNVVSPLFSREELLFFKNRELDKIPKTLNRAFRLIPCKAVTGKSMLKAFVPQMVKIKTEKKQFKTNFCTIAITDHPLSQGEYGALLNNSIFENVREDNNYDNFIEPEASEKQVAGKARD